MRLRVLQHDIFDIFNTSRVPKAGVSPKVETGVCLIFFSICSGLSGEPGEPGFLRNLPAETR